MKNEIGIGILDLYSEDSLEACISSIPEEYSDNIWIASNKHNSRKNVKNYSKQVPMATLRNYLISQMRIKGLKYYFLLNSNTEILNAGIFEKTITIAKTFGTWFITGPSLKNIPIEDDTLNITLNVSPELNTNFLFLYSGIIKNFGYFDERFYNTKDLDVLDYINKLRDKEVYPPKHYNPTIDSSFLLEKKEDINKINFIDIPKNKEEYKPSKEKSLELSVAYFYHKYKYVPTQNDPNGASQEDLLKTIENIQKIYGDKKNENSKL